MKYVIKCDDCKKTIGRTNSMARSAQGGRCTECRSTMVPSIGKSVMKIKRV